MSIAAIIVEGGSSSVSDPSQCFSNGSWPLYTNNATQWSQYCQSTDLNPADIYVDDVILQSMTLSRICITCVCWLVIKREFFGRFRLFNTISCVTSNLKWVLLGRQQSDVMQGKIVFPQLVTAAELEQRDDRRYRNNRMDVPATARTKPRSSFNFSSLRQRFNTTIRRINVQPYVPDDKSSDTECDDVQIEMQPLNDSQSDRSTLADSKFEQICEFALPTISSFLLDTDIAHVLQLNRNAYRLGNRANVWTHLLSQHKPTTQTNWYGFSNALPRLIAELPPATPTNNDAAAVAAVHNDDQVDDGLQLHLFDGETTLATTITHEGQATHLKRHIENMQQHLRTAEQLIAAGNDTEAHSHVHTKMTSDIQCLTQYLLRVRQRTTLPFNRVTTLLYLCRQLHLLSRPQPPLPAEPTITDDMQNDAAPSTPSGSQSANDGLTNVQIDVNTAASTRHAVIHRSSRQLQFRSVLKQLQHSFVLDGDQLQLSAATSDTTADAAEQSLQTSLSAKSKYISQRQLQRELATPTLEEHEQMIDQQSRYFRKMQWYALLAVLILLSEGSKLVLSIIAAANNSSSSGGGGSIAPPSSGDAPADSDAPATDDISSRVDLISDELVQMISETVWSAVSFVLGVFQEWIWALYCTTVVFNMYGLLSNGDTLKHMRISVASFICITAVIHYFELFSEYFAWVEVYGWSTGTLCLPLLYCLVLLYQYIQLHHMDELQMIAKRMAVHCVIAVVTQVFYAVIGFTDLWHEESLWVYGGLQVTLYVLAVVTPLLLLPFCIYYAIYRSLPFHLQTTQLIRSFICLAVVYSLMIALDVLAPLIGTETAYAASVRNRLFVYTLPYDILYYAVQFVIFALRFYCLAPRYYMLWRYTLKPFLTQHSQPPLVVTRNSRTVIHDCKRCTVCRTVESPFWSLRIINQLDYTLVMQNQQIHQLLQQWHVTQMLPDQIVQQPATTIIDSNNHTDDAASQPPAEQVLMKRAAAAEDIGDVKQAEQLRVAAKAIAEEPECEQCTAANGNSTAYTTSVPAHLQCANCHLRQQRLNLLHIVLYEALYYVITLYCFHWPDALVVPYVIKTIYLMYASAYAVYAILIVSNFVAHLLYMLPYSGRPANIARTYRSAWHNAKMVVSVLLLAAIGLEVYRNGLFSNWNVSSSQCYVSSVGKRNITCLMGYAPIKASLAATWLVMWLVE